MAIFKLGAMFDAISGKVGGQSLCNYPQQQILRNITQTNKFATPKQSKKRAFTAYLTNSWRQLTTAQRQGWDATAVNYTYVNRVGDTITRNGYQTFCFCNQNLNLIEIPTIDDAPLYVPVTEPKINITDISSGNFEIQSNNASSDYLFALFGIANLSPGQNAQLGMLRYIGEITAAQLTAGYDVVSDLEDVFGTLSFPNKMAITVDPINQTTGNRKQFVEIIQNIDLPMILEVVMPSATSATIPFATGGTYNGSIDWGDGTTTTFVAFNSAGCTHTYTLAGTYRILIYGAFPKFTVANGAFKAYLTNILQFGTNTFTALNFHYCTLLLNVNPIDTPTLGTSCTLFRLFSNTNNSLVCANIENWETSKVISMSEAFYNMRQNIADLSKWDLQNVVTIAGMFYENDDFNSNITLWNVSKVTNATNFLYGANKFNQNIGSWNVAKITNFTSMLFRTTLFNQNLASWDIRLATSMVTMLSTSGMSVTNWNLTLIGWAALVNPPATITITCPVTPTGAGLVARDFLIASYGWTFLIG